MSTTSEVHDVGKSKQEALLALLNSLVPNGQMTLPADADIDKLTEKLDELLASKGGLDAYTDVPRDDQGRTDWTSQPLNEEGLPIMEIVEPVNKDPSGISTPPTGTPSRSGQFEPAFSPLPNWALSPAALAARRQERDRILDLLEQEEQEELAREAAAASEPKGRNEVPAAVRPTPQRTLDQVVRQPITQSGSAVSVSADKPTSSSLTIAPNNGSLLSRSSDTVASQAASEPPRPKKQKSVSFADPPRGDSSGQPRSSEPELDWGDVIPVPLNSSKSGPAKTTSVMKDLVMERPFTQSSPVGRMADSDDEDEDEGDQIHDMPEDEEDSETEVPKEALGQLATSDDESDADEGVTQTVDIDDTDFDEAMLQREIALAYYARRNQMGPDVTSGPLSDSNAMDRTPNHDDETGDQLDRSDTQSNTTRFRRSRLDGDPQRLINSAVQFGRVIDGELVADNIADKEVDASMDALTGADNKGQEDLTEKTIELLRRGNSLPVDDPKLPQNTPPKDQPASVLGPRAPTSKLGPVRAVAQKTPLASKPAPKAKTTVSNPGTSQSTPAPASQFTQPMIIESGFGFDPAFQVAPPKPKPDVVRAAPMSETVKERAPTIVPNTRGRGGSRFAQARRANQSPTPTVNATTTGRDVIERVVPDPTGESKSSEPPKRVSRFRAERAGFL